MAQRTVILGCLRDGRKRTAPRPVRRPIPAGTLRLVARDGQLL